MKEYIEIILNIIKEYLGLIAIMAALALGLKIIQAIAENEERLHTRTLNQYEQLERFHNTKDTPKWRKVLPSER